MTPEQQAKQFMDALTDEQRAEMFSAFKNGMQNLIAEEVALLQAIQTQITELEAEEKQLWEQYRQMEWSAEKSKLMDVRQGKQAVLNIRKKQLMFQKNIVQAVENGGSFSEITDAKGVIHTKVADFRRIDTTNFAFDEDNFLDIPKPSYIPVIDEDKFRIKGYMFDAIRISKDSYLLATTGYDNKPVSSEYSSPFVILTLEQLVLTQDYYFTAAKVKNKQDAEEKSVRQEKYWDSLPDERRERFLNQPNLYHSLPAKIQKTISKADYEALTWQEKEKIYKFYKRYGAKRLTSRLADNEMWTSFHEMYEQFINPAATMPKPRVANREVFDYWRKFREMMDYMIKDIKIQRQDQSETYKQAIETSFGESNTNASLKQKYGILVKRQDGKQITPIEINQIEQTWIKLNNVFGNLKPNAEKYNLKISHTATTNVFASKAIGVFIPSMGTIAVSNKYGENQFELTFAHEVGHFIDNFVGETKSKRFATDNYEDTAGIIAFTFRNLMNKPKNQQTDYINATKECFARAFEQYYAWKLYGEDAVLAHSYVDLGRTVNIYAADDFVNKQNFEQQIVPLIEQFLAENQDILATTIAIEQPELKQEVVEQAQLQEEIKTTTTETNIPQLIEGLKLLDQTPEITQLIEGLKLLQ